MEIKHYFQRSEAWFDFLTRHPEYRTKHILMKLYNRYMLGAVSFHILINNAH